MYPSLFNDVFGPIMIGPSSSAFAGPTRIAQMAHGIYGGIAQKLRVFYIPGSGRAYARFGFSTDYGILTGALGRGPADERLYSAFDHAKELGMEVDFVIEDFDNNNDPDAIQLQLSGVEGEVTVLGHSLGGGIIRISRINDFSVQHMQGEEYALLLFHAAKDGFAHEILSFLKEELKLTEKKILHTEACLSPTHPEQALTIVYMEDLLEDYARCREIPGVSQVKQCQPVLPVVTKADARPPYFDCVEQMVALAEQEGVDCAEIAIRYEMGRSLWSREEVIAYMRKVWRVIQGTIDKGISGEIDHNRGPFHYLFGKTYHDRVKRGESLVDPLMADSLVCNLSAWDGYLDKHTLSVAGPAAGAPSIMGGSILPMAKKLGKSEDDIVRAMFVAAAIGAVAYTRTAPTGEVTGCSGESGVGSAMASGAIVQLAGGTPQQVGAAAAIALMNMFGLPCDTIAGGGCAMPCRGRTSIAPINAIVSAELAMSGFPNMVPYDQVLDALDDLFGKTPGFMKGNGSAGIPQTPTAKKIVQEYTEWSLAQR